MADQPFVRVEVMSPEGPVFEGDVAMVVLPAWRGELGILPRHAPLVARLAIGEMRVKTLEGRWLSLALADGFAKVQDDKVIVLADVAELASEIDVERARKALERATTRLQRHREGAVDEEDEIDPFMEQTALRRAKNRLKVVQRA